jgi:DNA-binding transcriptional regulator YhcF (GntR family)
MRAERIHRQSFSACVMRARASMTRELARKSMYNARNAEEIYKELAKDSVLYMKRAEGMHSSC